MLSGHEMITASYMGWGHLKNGELLRINSAVSGSFQTVECDTFSRKEAPGEKL